MKPVGTAPLVVFLSSLVVGGVVLSAPEINPAWSLGALALLSAVVVVIHGRGSGLSAKRRPRKRIIFQKLVRVKDAGRQREIMLRIVDARESRLPDVTLGSARRILDPRRSRTL
jgi:hypothetical protein